MSAARAASPAIDELERLEQELTRLLGGEAVRAWRSNGGGRVNGPATPPPPELLEAGRVAERLQTLVRELPTKALHALAESQQAPERRSRYFG
jgi:hypothetical protein